MSRLQLPKAHRLRLARIIDWIEREHQDYRHFRGKRLQQNPLLVSIPVGRNWRALFAENGKGYRFHGCFSHEQYNKMKFQQIRP